MICRAFPFSCAPLWVLEIGLVPCFFRGIECLLKYAGQAQGPNKLIAMVRVVLGRVITQLRKGRPQRPFRLPIASVALFGR